MPREILVDWTTSSGGGKVSVFMCDLAGAVGSQRLALNDFLGALDASMSTGNSWVIRNAGRELDDATGALTGAWSTGLPYNGAGSVGTEEVADATQILFQWHTNVIINGRFLRGRQFFPGLAASNLASGNLSSAVALGFKGYGDTLIASGSGFGVWHRPQGGAGGQFEPTATCTVWNELAVLRRRRG